MIIIGVAAVLAVILILLAIFSFAGKGGSNTIAKDSMQFIIVDDEIIGTPFIELLLMSKCLSLMATVLIRFDYWISLIHMA